MQQDRITNNKNRSALNSMKVPLLDLTRQYTQIRNGVLAVTHEIYDSQRFIMGPHVEALETEIAHYCGVNFGIGVSSGSDALLIALMAAGIGAGDCVITTPYSFFATAGTIFRLGARPVFVDIRPDTFNLDPNRLEKCIAGLTEKDRQRIKAIIPVHLYGQCADMPAIMEIAKHHGWIVIEDAAQAIGAESDRQRAGSWGDMGCFSFFPSKNLGAFGDGGMVVTHDSVWRDKLEILRNHGADPKYYHQLVGGNFRLDALQAAIVAVKLKYLDRWSAQRAQNADRYRQRLASLTEDGLITLPSQVGARHIYNQFVIICKRHRDALRQSLTKAGIGTEIYYPVPLHLQACFKELGYQTGDFPTAEFAAKHSLALPIFPELTNDEIDYVADSIIDFYQNN